MLGSLMSQAQTDTSPARSSANSPYSFYGIGDLVSPHLYHIDQMGGIGNSYSGTYTINVYNPASYASLARTSFDVGVWAKNSQFKEVDQKLNVWSGNLGYLSLGFPLINPLSKVLDRNDSPWTFGAAFTLKPVSRVSYNISNIDTLANIGAVKRSFTGNGGVNEFVFGTSAKYKDLSFGLNVRYLFGNIEKSRNALFSELVAPYNDIFESEYSLRSFNFELGAMYDYVLNKAEINNSKERIVPQRIQMGATFGFANSLNTKYENRNNRVQTLTSTIDTVSVFKGNGDGTMPMKFGVGATYFYGTKLALGADFSSTQWSQYWNEAAGTKKGDLRDSYKISVGGFYRPSLRAYSTFWQRVQYKFGFIFENDYRKVNNEGVNRKAVTFGFGLPFLFQRKFSQANLGVEIGKIGQGTSVEETYFNVKFGFSFGDDQWFIKRKYN